MGSVISKILNSTLRIYYASGRNERAGREGGEFGFKVRRTRIDGREYVEERREEERNKKGEREQKTKGGRGEKITENKGKRRVRKTKEIERIIPLPPPPPRLLWCPSRSLPRAPTHPPQLVPSLIPRTERHKFAYFCCRLRLGESTAAVNSAMTEG
jgi:hypothetical protein